MRRILKRAGDKLKPGSKQTSVINLPPLPCLPLERTYYNLTPSPSQEKLAFTSLNNYGLFSRLPARIRRRILTYAFGDRTIHVDLTVDRPLRQQKTNSHERSHAGIGTRLVRDTEKRTRSDWQWFSCVCHRRDEYYFPAKYMQTIEPFDDQCLQGMFCKCEDWEGSLPDKCFVGIMGWLLTCRQAYVDGMDVLFATNTYHFSSLPMMLNLQQLFLPHRLETIRSLEMIWKLDFVDNGPHKGLKTLWKYAARGQKCPDSQLQFLCKMIPQTFPHLNHLYISLQSWIGPLSDDITGDLIAATEKFIFGPLETMFKKMGPVREYRVAVQLSLWKWLIGKCLSSSPMPHEVEINSAYCGRYWKALGRDNGYWICMGYDDSSDLGGSGLKFDPWAPIEAEPDV